MKLYCVKKGPDFIICTESGEEIEGVVEYNPNDYHQPMYSILEPEYVWYIPSKPYPTCTINLVPKNYDMTIKGPYKNGKLVHNPQFIGENI